MAKIRPHSCIWPALTFLFCAFIVFFPVTDTDIWWHLAAGREMYARMRLLYTDPFSYSIPDAPWINLHWGFQLFAYGLHCIGGIAAILAAKCLLFAFSCVLLVCSLPRRWGRAVPSVLACLAAYEVRFLVLERPAMLTLVCMALFIFCLEHFRRTRNILFLFPLPFTQLLWVNSQGLYPLGLFILAAYGVGWLVSAFVSAGVSVTATRRAVQDRDFRRLLLFAAMTGAACFINPYGLRGLLFPVALLGRIDPSSANIYALNVSENLPLRLLFHSEPRMAWATVLVVGLYCGCALLARRSFRFDHAVLFAGFTGLAWMAQRNVLLFMCVAIPVAASAVENVLLLPVWNRLGGRRSLVLKSVSLAIAAVLLIIRLADHAAIVGRFPSGTLLSPFRHPEGAAGYLRSHWIGGNIFNDVRDGGYLAWMMYPPRRVFIDGRLIIRPAVFFREYLRVLDEPEYFDAVAARYGVTHVLAPTALFYRHLPLVRKLYRDKRWRLVYTDGVFAILIRQECAPTEAVRIDDPAAVAGIVDSLEARWRNDPAILREACIHLSRFCAEMGEVASARLVLQRMRGRLR